MSMRFYKGQNRAVIKSGDLPLDLSAFSRVKRIVLFLLRAAFLCGIVLTPDANIYTM